MINTLFNLDDVNAIRGTWYSAGTVEENKPQYTLPEEFEGEKLEEINININFIRPALDLFKQHNHPFDMIYPTGSVLVNYEGNDLDFVCLTKEPRRSIREVMVRSGFEMCGREYENLGDFAAYRRGNINLIVVFNQEDFFKWVEATGVMKYYPDDYKEKEERVNLFEEVRVANVY